MKRKVNRAPRQRIERARVYEPLNINRIAINSGRAAVGSIVIISWVLTVMQFSGSNLAASVLISCMYGLLCEFDE